jgi:hypothetical protein
MGHNNTEIHALMHPAFWRGADKSHRNLFSCEVFIANSDITGVVAGWQLSPSNASPWRAHSPDSIESRS